MESEVRGRPGENLRDAHFLCRKKFWGTWGRLWVIYLLGSEFM